MYHIFPNKVDRLGSLAPRLGKKEGKNRDHPSRDTPVPHDLKRCYDFAVTINLSICSSIIRLLHLCTDCSSRARNLDLSFFSSYAPFFQILRCSLFFSYRSRPAKKRKVRWSVFWETFLPFPRARSGREMDDFFDPLSGDPLLERSKYRDIGFLTKK